MCIRDRFGTEAIAAQKIGFQIESVSFMIIGGLQGAVVAFTGQNFGAKRHGRVVCGYHSALKIGLSYSGIMTLIFLLFNVPLIRLFVRDELTVSMASGYLIVQMCIRDSLYEAQCGFQKGIAALY